MRDCPEVTRQQTFPLENHPKSPDLPYLAERPLLSRQNSYLENSATNFPSLENARLWKMYRHDLRVARSISLSPPPPLLLRDKIDRQKRL